MTSQSKELAPGELAKIFVDAGVRISRRKAPGYTELLERVLNPTIGESILRMLRISDQTPEELQEGVKAMSGKLYNDGFYEAVIGGYLGIDPQTGKNLISYDETKGTYSLTEKRTH